MILALAACSMLASFGIGHAGELAKCTGTARIAQFPPQVSGNCAKSFSIGRKTAVVVTLTPDAGYTGTLAVSVTKPGEGATFYAEYVGSILVSQTGSNAMTLSPGDWKLKVETYSPICNPAQYIPGSPGCNQGVNFGFGGFTATVATASSGEPV
ncbi:MAG: hypothetical protein NVSMB57_05840 [Actinomycetota bacterium]